MKKFKKSFLKRHISSNHFEKAQRTYIYVCVWFQKSKRENFQENFIAKCSLNNSWANTCKFIKSSSMDLHCNILLLKREFFFHSSYSMKLIKGPRVSWVVRIHEHKGWVVPLWFRSCKGFYKDSGNFKWVAWVLDVGTGSGRTSIKLCLHSLFPYLIYVVAINLCLACLKNIIKLIVVSSAF